MVQREQHFTQWMPSYVALSIMGISAIALHVIDRSTANDMLSDAGLIQTLTSVALFAGAALCLRRAMRRIPPVFKWAELSFLLVIYALREMDFHRRFTVEHISNKDFYIGPDPLLTKIIAGTVVLLTIIALLHFLLSNARFFFEQLRKKRSWAIHVIAWAVLLFGSQILDKSPQLHDMFIEHVLEENMEFAAATILFLVLLKYPIRESPISRDAAPGLKQER